MSAEFAGGLDDIIQDIGAAGIVKMADSPGLAAVVDQHAAAVRDVITASGVEVSEQTLLDYLHGFTGAAIERGWWPDSDTDWEFHRVVAVCWLMSRETEGMSSADMPPALG